PTYGPNNCSGPCQLGLPICSASRFLVLNSGHSLAAGTAVSTTARAFREKLMTERLTSLVAPPSVSESGLQPQRCNQSTMHSEIWCSFPSLIFISRSSSTGRSASKSILVSSSKVISWLLLVPYCEGNVGAGYFQECTSSSRNSAKL